MLLTKCCLLEEHVERDDRRVVVPWGASFTHLRDGLAQAVAMAVPADRGPATPPHAGEPEERAGAQIEQPGEQQGGRRGEQ